MITTTYDQEAGELIVHTPQGIIVINECVHPARFTRVALSPLSADGYVTTSEGKPAIMAMWSGVQIVEPDPCEDDTEKMLPLFIDDEEET